MSEYTHITIFNGTPYDFIKGAHQSYQMDDWDSAFPNTIPSGGSARLQVSFQHPFLHYASSDSGEQVYILTDVPGSFKITGNNDGACHLKLDATNLHDQAHQQNPPLGVFDMGWKEDSELYCWIAGRSDGYIVRHWWLDEQA